MEGERAKASNVCGWTFVDTVGMGEYAEAEKWASKHQATLF